MFLLMLGSLIAASSTASGIARHHMDRQKLFALALSEHGASVETWTLTQLQARLQAPSLIQEDLREARLVRKAVRVLSGDRQAGERLLAAVSPDALALMGSSSQRVLRGIEATLELPKTRPADPTWLGETELFEGVIHYRDSTSPPVLFSTWSQGMNWILAGVKEQVAAIEGRDREWYEEALGEGSQNLPDLVLGNDRRVDREWLFRLREVVEDNPDEQVDQWFSLDMTAGSNPGEDIAEGLVFLP